MPEKLCIHCHEKPVAGGLSWAEFCGDDCAHQFEADHWAENHSKLTVEEDIVAPPEIPSVVKRALSEGWTIIAITPYQLSRHSTLLQDQLVTNYLIIRSR